jgi:hypothetical protein
MQTAEIDAAAAAAAAALQILASSFSGHYTFELVAGTLVLALHEFR